MTQFVFTIRLDRRTMAALNALARAEQRTKADTLRRMILRDAQHLAAQSAAPVDRLVGQTPGVAVLP